MQTKKFHLRFSLGLLLLVIFCAIYIFLDQQELLAQLQKVQWIKANIQALGWFGPVVIIALITTAVVLSPIPSAPIALAAGAVYGHTWGTLYVLIGAELGALIAFAVAKLLGHELLKRFVGEQLGRGLIGSQNMLMGIVFVSRLMPFISFDIISYLAGLSVLRFWRFAIATLAGIAPASFLLAHFGSEMMSFDMDRVLYALALLGLISGLSWLLAPKFKQWFSQEK